MAALVLPSLLAFRWDDYFEPFLYIYDYMVILGADQSNQGLDVETSAVFLGRGVGRCLKS